ncbi:MAG TPA: bifunctional riboflavin kinase/FAD synthetase [Actinomycetota bacterium]|nr:bifunctional riboflavin kinase/FAD synthetase [Actinomycetota bacterium]
MEIVRGLASLPLPTAPSVATVGFFDGVHLGHRAVFRRVVDRAEPRGLRSVAITFDRHPREVLTPGREPRLLTTVDRKAELIAACGIDVLVVLAFDRDFSLIPADTFVREVLAGGVHAVHAAMGENFRFGFKALGTMETLPTLAEPSGMTAETVPLLRLGDRPVSSSSIREALTGGDLSWPARALDRRFVLDGEVVTGHGRGRELGFPTANLRTWPRLLLPGQGIYAGVAEHRGARYRAAIDVGTNPTFGVEPLHVEAFLLDYDGGELPGEPLAIEFWARLRDEVRYDSIEDLVRAMDADVARTRELVPPEALVAT